MAKKIIAIAIVIFLILGTVASFVFGEEINSEPQMIVNNEETCKEFARLYIEGKSFDKLFQMYDKVKAMRMPKEYFSNQLKNIEHITGKFQSFGKYQLVKNENYDVHVLYLNMEKKTVIMMLTMAAPYREKNNENIYSKIHNLQFAIADSNMSSSNFSEKLAPAEDGMELQYSENSLKIGKEPYMLEAKITSPKAEGKYPAVVLIQDEGPFDMDYTMDNSAIFNDVSQFFAKNGIITIRYNKREYQYSDILEKKDLTPQETIIADAVEAFNTLLNEENVDKNKIYIMAHGYSSYFAPSILEQIKEPAAGLIYFSSSPLSELNLKNMQTANKFNTLSNDDLLEAITENLADFEKSNKLAELSESEAMQTEIFGRTAYYYTSQAKYKNDEIISKQNLPMLILHGSKDENIPVNYGIELWDKKFYGNDNVVRKLYVGLDHWLIKDDEDNISETVLVDMAAWIKQNKGE